MVTLPDHDEMFWLLLEVNGKTVLVKQMYPLLLERAGMALAPGEVVAMVTSLVGKFAGELLPATYDWVGLYLGVLILDGKAYRQALEYRTEVAA